MSRSYSFSNVGYVVGFGLGILSIFGLWLGSGFILNIGPHSVVGIKFQIECRGKVSVWLSGLIFKLETIFVKKYFLLSCQK